MTYRRASLLLVLAGLAALAGCQRGDLDSPDPARRAAAVRAVGERHDDADLPRLVVAQRDGSAEVRRAAAEAFAARRDGAAADALGALLADPDPGVVEVAARGLANMPGLDRAREDLLLAYGHASPAGRAAVAGALAALGTSLREAVEAEAKALWERNAATLSRSRGAERAGAAEEVGASGRAEAVARLVPLVDPRRNPDPLLAAGAARGLGEAGDWAARGHLEALLAEGDAELAEAAAGALARLGDPNAADALAGAAVASGGRVALAAAEALAALPPAPEVGAALCELAAKTLDPGLAARAARQVRLRDAECPDRPFLNRLSRPGAAAALAALGHLGLPAAAAAAAAERIIPLLDPARAPDPAVRAAAARALALLGAAPALPSLRRRFDALQARVVGARARWVPGALPVVVAGGFAGEGRLAHAVGSRAPIAPAPGGSPPVAAPAAVPGSSPRGTQGPAPEWIDAAAPSDLAEWGAVAAALGRLRAPDAAQLLKPLATDPAPPVRAGAVEGLARAAPDAPEVEAALADPEPDVRQAAAEGLAAQGPRGAPPLARAALALRAPDGRGAGPDDPEWPAALARALGDAGSGEAVPALAALLDGPGAAAAAAALGRTGAPSAVAPLVARLSGTGGAGRVEAIESLAQLAARDGAPAIADQLVSDRPEVRAAAARALGRLRHEPASARLEALRSDYFGRVRKAAVEALAKLPTGAPRLRP